VCELLVHVSLAGTTEDRGSRRRDRSAADFVGAATVHRAAVPPASGRAAASYAADCCGRGGREAARSIEFADRIHRFSVAIARLVRLYWILALFAVALFLMGIILSLVLEGPQATFRAPSSEDSLLQLLGQPRQSTSEYAHVLQAYDRFKWFSLKVIVAISSILMVRVSCEMLVVAFNIANSLKSIEQKIDVLEKE
jgi:hypothetical protein